MENEGKIPFTKGDNKFAKWVSKAYFNHWNIELSLLLFRRFTYVANHIVIKIWYKVHNWLWFYVC